MKKHVTGFALIFAAALVVVGCACANCAPAVACSIHVQGQPISLACENFDCDCPSSRLVSFGYHRECLDVNGNSGCTGCAAVGCITCTVTTVAYQDDNCYEFSSETGYICNNFCVYL